jgi:hypothetical protein
LNVIQIFQRTPAGDRGRARATWCLQRRGISARGGDHQSDTKRQVCRCTLKREEVWAEAARSFGIDVETFTENLRDRQRVFDREAAERLLAERLAALPGVLTEHESVIERRELVRAVAAAFVGTGLSVERADNRWAHMQRCPEFPFISYRSQALPMH